jgi:hypothetical protein
MGHEIHEERGYSRLINPGREAEPTSKGCEAANCSSHVITLSPVRLRIKPNAALLTTPLVLRLPGPLQKVSHVTGLNTCGVVGAALRPGWKHFSANRLTRQAAKAAAAWPQS